MKFSDLPYARPNVDALVEDYKALIARAKAAQTGEELLAVWDAHEKLDCSYGYPARLAAIRHTIDTRDPFYDAENDFFDRESPRVGNIQLELYRACLASSCRGALEQKYGRILTDKLLVAVAGADDRVAELMQQENALVSEYTKLYASAMVEFDGQQLPLPGLGRYKESPDAATRRAAFEAEGRWFDAHREQFDDLYSRLVANRNAQAVKLGHADYSSLSYLRMGRLGYGPEEVAQYRNQVVRDVVPVVNELQHLKFARIGLPNAKFSDLGLSFKDGNAMPHGTSDEMLAAGHKMYRELSGETAEFIDFMYENELFDVLAKPGKAPGGYMEQIQGYAPFVFSNWNGTSADVDVLTHEMGHAFQGYVAQKQGLIEELFHPGMESCEIHSMSMEFLTMPWRPLFFGEDAPKYSLAHTEDSLFFLPYGCVVDEFQHIMYRQPHLTPDERNAVWMDLEHKYRPWIDFDNLPFYGRGAGWQRQLHIYQFPFYYIDYCLAQTVALQFFAAQLADPKDAWTRYLALVRKGGTETYAGLVESAGFVVPFADGSLKPVADTAARWIREHQV